MPGKHQHFQEPEVGCCGKYFLFGFNIVFWVLGALFLAIGLWAWGEKGVLSNISALTDLGGLDPVWLFVVVGGIMSVLGFAGCIGALRENTFLLKFFSVFLGLIFFLELATGILAFVFKDWIRDQLNLFINNNVKAYRDDIDLQNLIDFAQEYVSPASSSDHMQEAPARQMNEGASSPCAGNIPAPTRPGRPQGREPGVPLSQGKPAPVIPMCVALQGHRVSEQGPKTPKLAAPRPGLQHT